MNVTIKFNVGMTFAVIGYGLLLSPIQPNDPMPMLIKLLLPENLVLQYVGLILSVSLAILASMYIVKVLWNRLFPNLCGWKEINLAESYAISLFFTLFLIP